MKKQRRYILLLGVCIWSFSCVSVPVFVDTPTPEKPTATASPTLLPSATSTPTITPIPTPEGAGFVPLSFDIVFDTPLEELQSGDYLVFRTLGNSTTSQKRYNYVSLDGQQSGELFSINSPLAPGLNVMFSSGWQVGFYWLEKGMSGLLFLDLQTQQIKQFDPGCDGYTNFALPHSLVLDGGQFAFSCGESNWIWHFVDFDSGNITSYILPSLPYYDEYFLTWLSTDIALVDNIDRFDPRVCLLSLSQKQVNCFEDIPYWMYPVSEVSPDGNSIIVEYADPQNPGQEIFGLLPKRCLENSLENCEPTPLPNLIGDSSSTVWEYINWSPDGNTIILTQVDCLTNTHATKMWTYDVASQTIRLLRDDPGYCLYPRLGSWTTNGEHILLINSNPSNDWRIWLVSTETGKMTRVASDFERIIEVVGLIHMP